ncbi:MAG: aminotransferase class I/II-fold pyridoxal phosphate-dependent enzyme [Anaerolineales bacterium]|nr:MAG: aminotransferase class I/II-fold pyridoxal phosphate-dependent enzyme [Anaerolineales bacterium]
MDLKRDTDPIEGRIRAMCERVNGAQQADFYYYNIPINELHGGATVLVDGREMSMFASYSYLGLIGHPRINAAARKAIDDFGTGTHGVRTLAGTLKLHCEMEETIAEFKGTDDAVTFTSGYVTNLTAISSLVGRHDCVFSDKLNHASIVDGCLMSGSKFVRFRHNDMDDLEAQLKEAPFKAAKLVICDAVFSMDGDIIDLPRVVELCRKYDAWLMIDEAHSIGVLGKTGRGIEEHFNMEGAIDIKMGTLSKTIPSVGGYIAGSADLIKYLRHQSRAYIFSAALPPAQAAAAMEAFRVILEEPWRVSKLRENTKLFINGLKERGFDTMKTETAIVPLLCGTDEKAFEMTRESHKRDLFVLPVISPAVPVGLARLRTTVTAGHEPDEIERALDIFEQVGKEIGVL